MKQIGITETFDPCFVSDWEVKLLEANIIISKELSDEMIEKLLIVQDRIIFHHTVTGQGNSVLEPNVKSTEHEFEQFKKLIERGFPISHYVLRVDPIMPFNDDILNNTVNVLNLWKSYLVSIKKKVRCRISMIDMYNHVKERISKNSTITVPWNTFTAPNEYFQKVEDKLSNFKDVFVFESCAEQKFSTNLVTQIGCASYADLTILGVDISEYGQPENKQRGDCMCLAKKQILNVKPARCKHQCLYCFWK